jgi:very-short-patch-repair endonuclease
MAALGFSRQYSVGSYILDFHCSERKLAIEVDGGQHADACRQQHDAHRDSYLKELSILVIRFWNRDVLQNTEGVGKKIKEVEKHS